MARPMMRTKWAWSLVLDQFHFARFRVEDEDRADFLVRHVQVVLGVDGHAVGLGQLKQNFAVLAGRLRAREAVHPFLFLGVVAVSTCESFCAA